MRVRQIGNWGLVTLLVMMGCIRHRAAGVFLPDAGPDGGGLVSGGDSGSVVGGGSNDGGDGGIAGGDGGTTLDGGATVTADNGAQIVREGMCDFIVRCQLAPVDLATCQASIPAQQSGFDSLEALFSAVKAGKADMDITKVSQCLDAIHGLSCEKSPIEILAQSGCQEAFTGNVALGDHCIAEGECARGLHCEQNTAPSAGGCSGTCAALGKGECADARDCKSGQVCALGHCIVAVPAGADGQACGTGAACRSGLRCDAGICRALPGVNEACQPGTPCANATLVCVPTDAQSATCVVTKARGATCTRPFECGGLLGNLVCDVSGSGTCIDRPKSGPCIAETCDPTSALCDSSDPAAPVCRAFLSAGSECEDREQCGPVLADVDCLEDGAGKNHCQQAIHVACVP